MKRAADGYPSIEQSAKGLGVRITTMDEVGDVDLDDNDSVILNSKGMSVAPNWRLLPVFRIPQRLRHIAPKAIGNSNCYCFAMGKGEFKSEAINADIELIKDNQNHGVIAPRNSVSINSFRAQLATTRSEWIVDEL